MATIVGFSVDRNYNVGVGFGCPMMYEQRAEMNRNALLGSNVVEAKEIRWVLGFRNAG